MNHRWLALSVAVVLASGVPPAWPSSAPAAPAPAAQVPAAQVPAATSVERWLPPVDGPVVRRYEPPSRPFGPRHLGLDFAAGPGTPVRAAMDGVVVFAGRVGRHSLAVTIEHSGGRRTTYAYLRRIAVAAGVPVRRGTGLGESGATGPGHGPDVVHFGYRVAGVPQDPAPLFAPAPTRISLAPVDRPACPARP